MLGTITASANGWFVLHFILKRTNVSLKGWTYGFIVIFSIIVIFTWPLPMEGSFSKSTSEQKEFRFGYMLEKTNQVNIREWIKENKNIPFVAGAHPDWGVWKRLCILQIR